MILAPMRFKDYVWPHNPRVYEIHYRKDIVSHRVPFGYYSLQNMGRQHRVLRGEGEFVGQGAYREFQKLASLFYDKQPGTLVHPLWDTTTAYFVSLGVKQEPTRDYVSYTFEFWECYNGYDSSIQSAPASEAPEAAEEGGSAAGESQAAYYTVVSGDCLWTIAAAQGMSLQELVALNPQVKNPNLILPGDTIRIR